MAYEKKPNTGSLFTKDKQGNPNRPDFGGDVLIDGKEYWVSAWAKMSPKGQPWFSMSFKPKDEKPVYDKARSAPVDDLEDGIPF